MRNSRNHDWHLQNASTYTWSRKWRISFPISCCTTTWSCYAFYIWLAVVALHRLFTEKNSLTFDADTSNYLLMSAIVYFHSFCIWFLNTLITTSLKLSHLELHMAVCLYLMMSDHGKYLQLMLNTEKVNLPVLMNL